MKIEFDMEREEFVALGKFVSRNIGKSFGDEAIAIVNFVDQICKNSDIDVKEMG
jgi:hypothetical protein